MTVFRALRLAILILSITFLVAIAWEFAIEEHVSRFFGLEYEESKREHWQFVLYIVIFTALALVVPVSLLRKNVVARNRVEDRTSALQATNEALRESEERHRLLVETSPDATFVDREGMIAFANHAAAEMFGAQSSAEIIGKDPFDFIHPAEHASVVARRRALSDGRPANPIVERRLRRLDGSEFEGEARATQFTWDGKPAWLVIMRDITERKETERVIEEREERLRGIMNTVADGIITIDEDGKIESMNYAASLMFGYPAEEVRGQNVSLLMPEPYRSEHDQYLRNYLESGTARIIGIGPRELTGLRKDGTEFAVEVAITETQLGQNRLFIGALRDATERKREQELLQQAQKMETIGQLTGGVAHDFNNLLTTILGNLELMSDRVSDDHEVKQFADAALNATLRGADLTQRLLTFSRKQSLQPAPTAINNCVTAATELIGRTIGEDIEVATVLGGGLWNAMIDKSQLETALLNIAINARDAMLDGGKLTIETANAYLDHDYAEQRVEVTPGQYVLIAISDTGTGMPPEVMERAFEPFFTTKIVEKGTGLGLSMVFGFIKQSEGHVAIYSEPGNGTTVKLYLPRTTAAVTNGHVAARPRRRAMPTGNETILVVEDDADVRAFVTTALGVLGYNVKEAEDGPSAIVVLEGNPDIALLFTDIVLPHGMNGRELAEEILKRNPAIKVLYTSGYTENAVIHNGKLDEGVQLLTKPYTRESLARRVRNTLDS